jgi:glycosyltransferase involved in cell wall biosynthesis
MPSLPLWVLLPLVLGVNLTLWSVVGLARWLNDRAPARRRSAPATEGQGLRPADVAVLIPAHDEEAGIGATIGSALRLVSADNIHVIADGCSDATAGIAGSYGVNVLVLEPGQGKASGISEALEHFAIPDRFEVLLVIDADTELSEDYLRRGLPLLDDPAVSAVAGYAHSSWTPHTLGLVGRVLTAYRARLYASQQWMKYAQTWRHADVTPIVPGFASMYRTRVLSKMDINPPGLVIEDFNMTFELRHKRLGKVALIPAVYGVTQDPETLPDYYRQTSRWALGLFQTIRRHRLWPSGFSVALALFLAEVLIANVVFLAMLAGLIFMAVNPISGDAAITWGWYRGAYTLLNPFLSPLGLLLVVAAPDYALTVLSAAYLRRPSLLVYGPLFVLFRVIDAAASVRALYSLLRDSSTGRWTSPARRRVVMASEAAAVPFRTPPPAAPAPPAVSPRPGPARSSPRPQHARDAEAVLRDALWLAILFLLIASGIVLGLPARIGVLIGIAVALGAAWLAARTGSFPAVRAWVRRGRAAKTTPARNPAVATGATTDHRPGADGRGRQQAERPTSITTHGRARTAATPGPSRPVALDGPTEELRPLAADAPTELHPPGRLTDKLRPLHAGAPTNWYLSRARLAACEYIAEDDHD